MQKVDPFLEACLRRQIFIGEFWTSAPRAIPSMTPIHSPSISPNLSQIIYQHSEIPLLIQDREPNRAHPNSLALPVLQAHTPCLFHPSLRTHRCNGSLTITGADIIPGGKPKPRIHDGLRTLRQIAIEKTVAMRMVRYPGSSHTAVGSGDNAPRDGEGER